jgi:hypothetical protein
VSGALTRGVLGFEIKKPEPVFCQFAIQSSVVAGRSIGPGITGPVGRAANREREYSINRLIEQQKRLD